jgi:hypothetical protein
VTPEQLAWAWVAHLRAGGTTPWRDFAAGAAATEPPGSAPGSASAGPERTGPDARAHDALPGAAQLEVLRLLAERALSQPARTGSLGLGGLADRLLDRSGPGRGMAELPLLLPAEVAATATAAAGRIGPRPVDPGDVPDDELLRTALGLLADLLVEDPAAGRPPRRPGRPGSLDLLRRRGPRYRVGGAPVTAADLTGRLLAAGRRPGGRHPEVLLVVPPLEVALAEVWSARVQGGAPVRWRTFLDGCVRRGALPRGADAAAAAQRWAGRVGTERVHVLAGDPVRGPGGDPAVVEAAAEVLGLPPGSLSPASRPPGSGRPAGPLDPRLLSPAATDLLRRLNRVLSVRVDPDRHRALVRDLADRLSAPAHVAVAAPAVPARHRAWVAEQAARVADELRRGGYPVHGDPDLVARAGRRAGGPPAQRRASVELALAAVLDLAEDPRPRQREDMRR